MILTQSETLSNVAKKSKIAKKLDLYQKSKCTFLNSFQEALQLNKKKRSRVFLVKKGFKYIKNLFILLSSSQVFPNLWKNITQSHHSCYATNYILFSTRTFGFKSTFLRFLSTHCDLLHGYCENGRKWQKFLMLLTSYTLYIHVHTIVHETTAVKYRCSRSSYENIGLLTILVLGEIIKVTQGPSFLEVIASSTLTL